MMKNSEVVSLLNRESFVKHGLFRILSIVLFLIGGLVAKPQVAAANDFPLNITLTANGNDVMCLGQTKTLTATVTRQDNGTPVSNVTVQFATTEGTVNPTAARTDENGQATTTLSEADLGKAEVTASVEWNANVALGTPAGSASDSEEIFIIGGSYEVIINPHFSNRDMVVICPPSSSNSLVCGRAPGQQSGTTYLWEITEGTAYAHIEGANNAAFVTLKPDAPSGWGSVTLRLKYTFHGQDCYSTQTLTVHTPDRPRSSRVISGLITTPGPPTWTWGRNIDYTVRSQHNTPIPNVLWDETVWRISGLLNPTLTQGDRHTGGNGDIPDRFRLSMGAAWDGNANTDYYTIGQTIEVGGCPANGDFWSNRGQYTGTPDCIVTPTN